MTPFASRRTANRQTQATHQLIVFGIQQEWFALPIQVVHRVLPLEHIYGVSHDGGVGLTRHENQEVSVIDVEQRIFGKSSCWYLPPNPTISNHSGFPPDIQSPPSSQTPYELHPQEVTQQRYLLIVKNTQEKLIGIPLKSQPTLHRVPKSVFAPVPPAYLAEGKIRCISALVVLADDQPPVFLLNLDQLVQFPLSLLPNTGYS
jgi:purine-binding chemotaxis protein CheW